MVTTESDAYRLKNHVRIYMLISMLLHVKINMVKNCVSCHLDTCLIYLMSNINFKISPIILYMKFY